MAEFEIGQTVELGNGAIGTILWIGIDPVFASGDWLGVELDEGGGKNDGSILGERYFECQLGYGMFVRPANVKIIDRPAPPLPKAPTHAKKTSRPSSVIAPVARRTSSVPDNGITKRKSMNAPSPSPMGRRPSGIRVCSNPYSCYTCFNAKSSLPQSHPQNHYTLPVPQSPQPRELEHLRTLEHHPLAFQNHDHLLFL